MVVAFIFSEKTAVTLLAGPTPVARLAGDTLFTVGFVVSTVQVRLAVAAFPALSVAFTAKVWEPSPRPVYCCGEEQAANAPPSRLHDVPPNPLVASEAEKAKEA